VLTNYYFHLRRCRNDVILLTFRWFKVWTRMQFTTPQAFSNRSIMISAVRVHFTSNFTKCLVRYFNLFNVLFRPSYDCFAPTLFSRAEIRYACLFIRRKRVMENVLTIRSRKSIRSQIFRKIGPAQSPFIRRFFCKHVRGSGRCVFNTICVPRKINRTSLFCINI